MVWSTRPVHGARMKTLSGVSHIWVGDKRGSCRPDIVYSASLPPLVAWPTWLTAHRVLFIPATNWVGLPSANQSEHGISVKDSWGLMTRSAAAVYMGRDWQSKLACNHHMSKYFSAEAALGCTMFRGGVHVAAFVELDQYLVRPEAMLMGRATAPWEMRPESVHQGHASFEAAPGPYRDHVMRPHGTSAISFELLQEICDRRGSACMRNYSVPFALTPYSADSC